MAAVMLTLREWQDGLADAWPVLLTAAAAVIGVAVLGLLALHTIVWVLTHSD